MSGVGDRRGGAARPWVACPLCDLQQVRPAGETCARCGAELTAEPDLAPPAGAGAAVAPESAPTRAVRRADPASSRESAPDAPSFFEPEARRATGPPAPGEAARRGPPTDPSPGPPGADGIFDLAVDPTEEKRERRQKGLEIERRMADQATRAESATRSQTGLLGAILLAFVAIPVGLGKGVVAAVRSLPRLGEIPAWARWEILIALAVGLLVLLAFQLEAGKNVSGHHEDPDVGISLDLPSRGWYRFPVDVEGGQAAAYRSAAVLSDATAALWVRTLPVTATSPYVHRVPGQPAANPPVDQPLDAHVLSMDGGTLLERAQAAAELSFVITETRGCRVHALGARRVARCRYVARAEKHEWELDLFAFGDGARLLIVLLGSRSPVTSKTFAANYGIVASIQLLPVPAQ